MSKITDRLAKSLVQKDTVEQCTVGELEQLVNQFPYFGPAQLLLSDKLKSGNKSIYENQVRKTMLYINNPLWFNYIENETGDADILTIKQSEIKEAGSKTRDTGNHPSIIDKPEKETGNEAPLFEMKIPEKTGSDLTFEPYHTIDYFASQGIRFKEEENPTDRFGLQLKSFTDWLKAMKRLPETVATNENQISADKNIEHLAEHSIEDRNIITEAMAEVWEKQGNPEKAIAIYHKLSLHNPSKSPYFAAKIDQLKKPD